MEAPAPAAVTEISDFDPRKDADSVVEEIARLERKIFPKHESLSKSFHDELRKKNNGLIYLKISKGKDEEIIGYAMYSWISSLSASITKLAGRCFWPKNDVLVCVCENLSNSCLRNRIKMSALALVLVLDYSVKDNYRRQGHGELLLRAAIEKCRTRKIQRVCLHVDPARSPALLLYRKLGFQMDGLIQQYYSPERDAYRMFLEFDE
ncbi:hypothetical protein ZIOFF_044862 [Zingiber officinale]|uniref:N-acetyltransferase domain-containing protein n=1 Tax=Zingiber officinale TaxID=94328 RepID=A0A8J5G2W4_ZINOF|nr:hypothetical protein ZIOFF_044862 [Zingiber officinale]